MLELEEGGTLRVPASRIAGEESAPDSIAEAAAPSAEPAAALAEELRVGERWRGIAGRYAGMIESGDSRASETIDAVVYGQKT